MFSNMQLIFNLIDNVETNLVGNVYNDHILKDEKALKIIHSM